MKINKKQRDNVVKLLDGVLKDGGIIAILKKKEDGYAEGNVIINESDMGMVEHLIERIRLSVLGKKKVNPVEEEFKRFLESL